VRTIEVKEAIGSGRISGYAGDLSFRKIAIDSRAVESGDLFFALRGARTDGHLFVDDAVRRGASGVVCEKAPEGLDGTQFFVVPDALSALYDVAAWKRSSFRGEVIAVTGSNGKTTTKELISEVLSKRYNVLKSTENMNTKIGLSMALFHLQDTHDLLVLEMGTSHKGEIAELTKFVKPNLGLITNVSAAHLEGLGTVGEILEEKGQLLRMLPSDGRALVNGDDRRLARFAGSLGVRVWTYGIRPGNDFAAKDVVMDGFGRPSFMLDEGVLVRLPAIGLHNVSNAMAAVAVGSLFGFTPAEIGRGLEEAILPGMRTELIELDGVRFLLDCYNANPASMRLSIRTLSSIRAQRRIAVLGRMAELGGRTRALHISVGEEVARNGIDVLVAVGEEARAYVDGARKWSEKNGKIPPELLSPRDAEEAYGMLKGKFRRGDLVLFKASRTARLEVLVQMITDGA